MLGRVVGVIEQLLFEHDVASARFDELEYRLSLVDGRQDANEKNRAVLKAEARRQERDSAFMQALRNSEGD